MIINQTCYAGQVSNNQRKKSNSLFRVLRPWEGEARGTPRSMLPIDEAEYLIYQLTGIIGAVMEKRVSIDVVELVLDQCDLFWSRIIDRREQRGEDLRQEWMRRGLGGYLECLGNAVEEVRGLPRCEQNCDQIRSSFLRAVSAENLMRIAEGFEVHLDLSNDLSIEHSPH